MTALGKLKQLVNAGLRRRGHLLAHESAVPCWDRVVGALHRMDLTPKTVFDVGVAYRNALALIGHNPPEGRAEDVWSLEKG